jgi:hypothetical protein
MTFAVGDLGGGVKAQGSGDAGMAGQAQADQTSQGWSAPGARRTAVLRVPNAPPRGGHFTTERRISRVRNDTGSYVGDGAAPL